MKIQVVTPVVPNALTGNLATATRYARILRKLGHRVAVAPTYQGEPFDALLALHARRSFRAIQRFASLHPDRPLVVILTGTDLYRDIRTDAHAQHSLELATRLVVLQRMGLAELPERLQGKTRVIYQSAPPLRAAVARARTSFRVSVIGHLRPEKDPFRTALAVRRLPAASRIQVLHAGAAFSPNMEQHAIAETARNPRYRWLGGLPHARTRRLVASSHLLSITSEMEGSSNVLGEALAQLLPTPVVATYISGLIGTLGEDYPGYFPVGNTDCLTDLLLCAEDDRRFYEALQAHCDRAAPLVAPERERDAWAQLLAEVG
jgi:putative glycosyltransferase (TIGR04348 family)